MASVRRHGDKDKEITPNTKFSTQFFDITNKIAGYSWELSVQVSEMLNGVAPEIGLKLKNLQSRISDFENHKFVTGLDGMKKNDFLQRIVSEDIKLSIPENLVREIKKEMTTLEQKGDDFAPKFLSSLNSFLNALTGYKKLRDSEMSVFLPEAIPQITVKGK